MAAERNAALVRYIHRIAAQGTALSDRRLVEIYLEQRDEAAFATLVQRHGPRVLGVCRGILGHSEDVEDAFQATFLILARQAESIRKLDSLGSWLHGVAYRVGQRSLRARTKHQRVEPRLPSAPIRSPLENLSWGEVRSLLFAELSLLPEHFREPLVLCYLDGLTKDEAARRLGLSQATLHGRLQRGRERLRRRLLRCGIALPELGSAALFGLVVGEKISLRLVEATVKTAKAAHCTAAASAAAVLAAGATGPIFAVKIKLLALIVLLAVALAGVQIAQSPATDKPPRIDQPAPTRTTTSTDLVGDPLPEGAVARLGTMRFNHGEGMTDLHYSPDGKTIISVGGGLVRIWEVATGRELKSFSTGKPQFEEQTVLSPDGKRLTILSQSFQDTARIFDLESGATVRTVQLPVQRNEISVYRKNALSSDGRLCALLLPKELRVYNIDPNAKELFHVSTDQIQSVVFAFPNRLVTAYKNQHIEVLDSSTGVVLRQFESDSPVVELATSADGHWLATMEHHNHAVDKFLDKDVVRVWDLNSGKCNHALSAPPKSWVHRMRFSPDGKHLYTGCFHETFVKTTIKWNLESGKPLYETAEPSALTVMPSPDSALLAAWSSGQFHLRDAITSRPISTENPDKSMTASIRLSPSGDRVTTVAFNSISVWDGTSGRRLHSFDIPYQSSHPWPQAQSPNGRFAITFSKPGTPWYVKEGILWDVKENKQHTIQVPVDTHSSSAFSPDSSLLATCSGQKTKTIRIWDLAKGRQVASFEDEKAGSLGVVFFGGDAKTIYVAGHHVVGYDVATGKNFCSWRLTPLPGNGVREFGVGGPPPDPALTRFWSQLAFSPDGSLIACIMASDDIEVKPGVPRIVLCDARTGTVLRRWNDSGNRYSFYPRMSFSQDGRLLAASDGNLVHLREVATGTELRVFKGHRNEIESLAFSANGRRLASGSLDNTVLIWNVGAETRRKLTLPGPLPDLWADLAKQDGRVAYEAVFQLAVTPARSIPFLSGRLQPVVENVMKQIRQDVGDLDNDKAPVSDNGLEHLNAAGMDALPALSEALEKKPTAEARRRIEVVLRELENHTLSGETLRAHRALAVLEYAATPEARQILTTLAAGAPDAWLTREAKAGLQRMERLLAGRP